MSSQFVSLSLVIEAAYVVSLGFEDGVRVSSSRSENVPGFVNEGAWGISGMSVEGRPPPMPKFSEPRDP